MTSSSSTSLPDFEEVYSPRTFSFESFSLSRVPSGEDPEEGEVMAMTGVAPIIPRSESEGAISRRPRPFPYESLVIAG